MKFARAFLLFIFFCCFFPSFAQDTVTANMRFSHASHYQQNISCETCHTQSAKKDLKAPDGWVPLRPSRVSGGKPDSKTIEEVNASGTGSFARPAEKVCMACHSSARRKNDCGLCHLGKPMKTERDRARIKSGTLFPHEKHSKHDCMDCHPKIGEWDNLDGKQQDTSMEGCVACHNGVMAKKACTLCHAKTPWPKDHTRNYERKHGISYRSDPQSCKMCHEDSSCVACHAQRPRDHTLAWISRRHGFTAKSNPDKCDACHSNKEICLRCHATPPW